MSWLGWATIIILSIDAALMMFLGVLELWNRFCRRCSRKHENR